MDLPIQSFSLVVKSMLFLGISLEVSINSGLLWLQLIKLYLEPSKFCMDLTDEALHCLLPLLLHFLVVIHSVELVPELAF